MVLRIVSAKVGIIFGGGEDSWSSKMEARSHPLNEN
jgi:hypothetical protein